MADHIHPLPVCGFAPHQPHAPGCPGESPLIACGEIVDPNHPNRGQALCRHRDREIGIKVVIFVLVLFLLVVEWARIEITIVEMIVKVVVLVLTLWIIRIEHRPWIRRRNAG